MKKHISTSFPTFNAQFHFIDKARENVFFKFSTNQAQANQSMMHETASQST